MDTERDVTEDEDGWPPRPWDIEWAKRHTSLPEHLWGIIPADDPDPDPVIDAEPCLWCDQLPASDAGWAPGEMLDHVRAAHLDLIQPVIDRQFPPREPGVVLPPSP